MSLAQVAALRRPRPVVFSVSLVVAWLLLALLALGLRRGPIEDELSKRAVVAVEAQGGTGVNVTFDGRQATLHGTFPSLQAAEEARRAVAVVPGARSAALGADVRIVAGPAPGTAARPFVIAVDGGSITVTAAVPDQRVREQLLGAAAAVSSGTLTGQVTVDPLASGPPVATLTDVARALTAFEGRHQVTINGSVVTVEGPVADVEERARLGDAVLAAARGSVPAVSLDNRLDVRSAAPAQTDGAGTERLSDADRTVTFATNSSELSDDDRVRLDRIVLLLRDGTYRVLLAGHTDARGPRWFNETLSLARARAAAAYLSSRGVPAEQLRSAGFASDFPVATNDTADGRAANRRVEISTLLEPRP